MADRDLVDRLVGLCRDLARQAQTAGVTLGAPTRDDLTLLRAVLNGDPIAAESAPGGEGSGTGNDRQLARCATPTPGPQHLEDLSTGDPVEFLGHPMVVVTATAGVVELIAPDTEEPPR